LDADDDMEPDHPIADPQQPRTALVTGAAGFIGSHVTEACLDRGWSVIAVDALTDYYDPAIKRAHATALRADPACRFIEGDLLELDLDELLAPADVVFHLAAQPGVRASWGTGFDAYARNNITLTQRLLEAARRTTLDRFVLASSSSVYGDAETLPTEEDVVLRPVSPYGVTKVACENLAYLYWRNYGLPTITLRYFTVFGPRQRPDMAFHRLLRSALEGEVFRVFGDGNQTRDFTYVGDVVEATLRAGCGGQAGHAYNIGGGSRRSMNAVFELVEEITGRALRLEFSRSQRGDAADTGADIELARRDLGFAPAGSFRDGLESQFAWHLANAAILVPRLG
jgi:nucleoside-diphosphate-sugar epimerase